MMWRFLGRSEQPNSSRKRKDSSHNTAPLTEEEKHLHGKRLSQILRYISTLQTAGNGGNGQFLFARSIQEHSRPFYGNSNNNVLLPKNNIAVVDEEPVACSCRVLFTTYDFQQLLAAAEASGRQTFMPFSFYSTSSTARKGTQHKNSRKRTAWGTIKQEQDNSSSSPTRSTPTAITNKNSSSCCWLRLTRTASACTDMSQPRMDLPEIQSFLRGWSHSANQPVDQLLTLRAIGNAPPSTNPQVLRFLRRYQQYLHQKYLCRRLERIYNGLFEWYDGGGANNSNELDLIWGMGQAIFRDDANGILVDGPLLEVKVEVELARDGALLIRPRQHTGVTWNRSVLAALESTSNHAARDAGTNKSKKWNQLVEPLDPFQDINPSEPMTYLPLLKQLAVECAAGGTFVPSSSSANPSLSNNSKKNSNSGKLVVTDAWCLYASPRPSAVWARDALAFCEQPQPSSRGAAVTAMPTRPPALWALTHGPSAMERVYNSNAGHRFAGLSSFGSPTQLCSNWSPATTSPEQDIHFPLPTSEAQNRIARLLLTENYPAVVCEGPPGTGKTHTIANIVCAYLCQGKRVLVTSKGAPALSVLRERLPPCVQQLCVDVSMRESVGMRQLQQTVERLANKVSWIHTEREQRRSEALLQEINALKQELVDIDRRLSLNAQRKHTLVHTSAGQAFFETSLKLIESAPWLMRTVANWDVRQASNFYSQLKELVLDPPHDPIHQITGYPDVPSAALISLVASKAGLPSSYFKNLFKGAVAAIPWIGNDMSQHCSDIQKELDNIRVHGSLPPSCAADWKLILRALEKERAVQLFCSRVLDPLLKMEGWPKESFYEKGCQPPTKRGIKADVLPLFEAVLNCKQLETEFESHEDVKSLQGSFHLDSRRTMVSSRIQDLSEDYVACQVVARLSQNFTAEAQSALVKFAQVSGKSKFGKSSSSQANKLTQRQRRKRQEYLDAFEKCVRYIPCWILTSSQISDYLPSECLFDLVVIDEASQSDISVLPGMLRGKQWLIVGDGKQVSPTESFVAEDQIEMLKSALPDSPFESSMLPGHSFFDLCAQGYPRGRVILREHFRCAPEIIAYSNSEFYDDNLVPLRLPTSDERLNPSLVDVYLRSGRKIGKVNPEECDEIVRMIQEYVESCTLLKKRTIGVISLVGDEQSRLIRGRLLDKIGPHKYKLHDILVGEPPSFQGAERDIVFLSLVCSPGCVVTQNQLMHAQRANVALSRARDRMVLVRSIQSNHIPNEQDIKFSMLDFFERAKAANVAGSVQDGLDAPGVSNIGTKSSLSLFRSRAEHLLDQLLRDRGFCTQSMGVVWEHAICVEDAINKSARAAISIEATGESHEEWTSLFEQQKSIERVGWKCFRLDGSSFLRNHMRALADVERFLLNVGVRPSKANPADEAADEEDEVDDMEFGEEVIDDVAVDNVANHEAVADVVDADGVVNQPNIGEAVRVQEEEDVEDDIAVVVSSEDEDDRKAKAVSDSFSGLTSGLGNGETASDYGSIAALGFLQRGTSSGSSDTSASSKAAKASGVLLYSDDEDLEDEVDNGKVTRRNKRQMSLSETTKISRTRLLDDVDDTDENDDNDSEFQAVAEKAIEGDANNMMPRRSMRRKRSRLDKYSRDGTWYPSQQEAVRELDVPYEEYIGEVIPEPDSKMAAVVGVEKKRDSGLRADEENQSSDDEEKA